MKRNHIRSIFLALCLFLSFWLLVSCKDSTEIDGAGQSGDSRIAAVTEEEGTITVKVSLSQGFLSDYGTKKVYLLELPSHLDTVGDLSGALPVAEDYPAASLLFSVPSTDGARSRRYSSFVLASKDDEGAYKALTVAAALSNPEDTAPEPNGKTPTFHSIKGLSATDAADVIRLGASHTVVDVYINDLLAEGFDTSAVPFLVNGTTAYMNGDALAELDDRVHEYTDASVRVYLRFLLSASKRTAACADADLYFPGTEDSTAPYLSVNLSSARAAATMEGFFTFMADRYASPETDTLPVTAFLIGYRVNDPARYADAGETDADAYLSNYEKLLHIAYISLASEHPDGRVYIALDDRRTVNVDEADSGNGAWDAAAFLAAFRDEAALRGNYAWHVACELYADATSVWVDHASETGHYTIRNISLLTDLLVSEAYKTPAGDTRRLLVSGMSIPAVPKGEEASDARATEQAASYAFAYLTAEKNGQIEALIYDCHVDRYADSADGTLSGLWTAVSSYGVLIPSEKRPIYKVFKEIDTSAAADLSTQLTAIIGAPYTKLVGAQTGLSAPVTALGGHASIYETLPDGADALLLFEDGTLGGMVNAGNATYLELRRVGTDAEDTESANDPENIALHVRFDRFNPSAAMSVSTRVSASSLVGASELIFDLSVLPVPSEDGGETAGTDRHSLSATLRLVVPANGSEPARVYESTCTGVEGDRRQIAFHMEKFSALLADSDTVILTLTLDGGNTLSYDADLSGIYVTGAEETGRGFIGPVLIALAIAVPVIAIVAVVIIFVRRRRWDY